MASQIANNWKELMHYGIPQVDADTFKICLMEPGFAFSRSAHEVYADISAFELPTLGGYTAGGQALTPVPPTITNDAVLAAGIAAWNNAVWTATATLQACGAIIYDDTVAAPDVDPIAGFIDFGGTITVYTGGAFTVSNITLAYR